MVHGSHRQCTLEKERFEETDDVNVEGFYNQNFMSIAEEMDP